MTDSEFTRVCDIVMAWPDAKLPNEADDAILRAAKVAFCKGTVVNEGMRQMYLVNPMVKTLIDVCVNAHRARFEGPGNGG